MCGGRIVQNIMSKSRWVLAYTHITLSVHWLIDSHTVWQARLQYSSR